MQAFEFYGGQEWNRTTDTGIFSPLLYQLSYLAVKPLIKQGYGFGVKKKLKKFMAEVFIRSRRSFVPPIARPHCVQYPVRREFHDPRGGPEGCLGNSWEPGIDAPTRPCISSTEPREDRRCRSGARFPRWRARHRCHRKVGNPA